MEKLTLLECSKRKLDETYLVVYAIKNEINLKKGDYIEKKWCLFLNRYRSKGKQTIYKHIPRQRKQQQILVRLFRNTKS